MNLFILLVVVLAIIAIAQLTKVYDLSRTLRNSREEEVSAADNRVNANAWIVWMFVFFASVIYLYAKYGDYLPESASEHGVAVDKLMSLNIWLITIVFFIVNYLLFTFANKYRFNPNRKAKFFAHDNRLEMLWTLVPGVTMAFIIVYGLITWNNITGPASADAMKIELYSKQFDWTARYPGENKVFGAVDYNLIGTTNALGMVTKEGVAQKLAELDHNIESTEKAIADGVAKGTMPDSYMESLEEQLYKLKRHKQRILDLKENELNGQSQWLAGADDKIVKGEFHIPVGQEVEFVFRSQDVIHSAYMPHFRAQMNTVPGVPTRFKMKPTITTAEMRKKLGNDKFDYVLLCNKVCGAAHFNMKMTVVVDTPEDYNAWLAEQKTFGGEGASACF
ncbi:MAG: cytochrome c oxidase subunit II [Bacteroidetes bacterium]|nr:cytochrome c oxidase subunit II [Bacteroidota bacterium]